MWIIISLASLIFASIFMCNSLRYLNYFQLENYENFFSKKSKEYSLKIFFIGMISILLGYVVFATMIFAKLNYVQYVLPVVTFSLMVALFCNKESKCIRQPLVYTNRIKRFLIALFIILYAVCFATFYVGSLIKMQLVQLYFLFTPILVLIVPYVMWLVSKIVLPLENLIKKRYIVRCKKELATRKNLIKIGITGSYAKTSVKQILTDILSVKYKTYCTPFNFNTPMGICKAVAKMPKDTEIFVVEMGAKHVGDIKELCEIVDIDYAILTGISNQHLSSFKTFENIINTKMEIAEYAKSKNVMTIFNAFDENCIAAYNNFDGKKLLSSSENSNFEMPHCDENGSTFDLILGGEKIKCNTILLGIHNIQNILIASSIAKKIGLTMKEIENGIALIKSIPHRLQLQKTDGGISIIDDSYNSNVVGAKLGIDCLKMFDGRKIIATQGLVELGENEGICNKELGEYMSSVVDIAIVVGRNGSKIKEGLLNCKFANENIFVASDLESAKQIFSKLLKRGDTLYLQNDLPDNY